MLEEKKLKEKILNSLDIFKTQEIDGYIMICLPLVLDFNQQLLELRLYPTEDGYYVSDNGTNFEDCEYSCEQFYDLFLKNDDNWHYKIQAKGNYIYKKYDVDFSARRAIDEFIKVFVYLNDYILDYWNKE